jgi:hypothetical protein
MIAGFAEAKREIKACNCSAVILFAAKGLGVGTSGASGVVNSSSIAFDILYILHFYKAFIHLKLS